MIQNIEISKIHPHYDNPRKNLGDVTELAESIRSKGILQNLTVVPWFSKITGVGADDPKQQEEMGYIAVIGHRRLAAAKLAGLTEVPCAISNMSYKEQVATMLLENMQRSDLTIYEQAQGFQMMIDLGDSVNQISERTGFSETTVRRRVKLLELDGEKFKKSIERGATLMDYAELEKIHDIKLRNSVLEKIGTPNFNYELKRAIDKEKGEKNKAFIVAELKKFATEIKDTVGYRYVQSYSTSTPLKELTSPEDADTEEYFFTASEYSGYVTLYKKWEQSKSNTVQDEKEKERRKRNDALNEISNRAYQLRQTFITGISNTSAKKNMPTICEYALRGMLNTTYYAELQPDEFAELLDIKVGEDDDDDEEEKLINEIYKHVTAQPERHLLLATYLLLESSREHYYNCNNQHNDNKTLNRVYDFLEKFGYEMSDEERMLRDGTHELFKSQ